MKVSKKLRFLLSLTALLVCVFMETVAVSADMLPIEGTEETTLSQEDAKTYAGGKINVANIKSLIEEYVGYVSPAGTWTKEELEYAVDKTSAQTDVYENFAKAVGEEPCGAYKSYDGLTITETEEGDGVTAEVVLHYADKDLKMTINISCFDTLGPVVTSSDFGLADAGEKSFGDKMAEAGSNTIMGMGVVFVVLIFISFLISLFKFIPAITEKLENRKKKPAPAPATDTEPVHKTAPVVTAQEDNTELIAVIAAAIAASEHTTTDSFVVRSIRRRV